MVWVVMLLTRVAVPMFPEDISQADVLVTGSVCVVRMGFVSVGAVPKTATPVPVSSVSAEARFALLGVARKDATLLPSPLTPVLIGKPVALESVPLLGVPKAPFSTTNAPAEPTLTPSAVATPVPNEVIPVPPLATGSVPVTPAVRDTSAFGAPEALE